MEKELTDLNKRAPVSLSDLSSFKVGGKCHNFYAPKSILELQDVLRKKIQKSEQYSIFGYGTNILFSDNPDPSKHIVSTRDMNFVEQINGDIVLSAGVPLSFLSFMGMYLEISEWLNTFLLPGSLGAGVFINAKYHDFQISDIISKVYYFDPHLLGNNFPSKKYSECHFGYKKSIFQSEQLIITGVVLKGLENRSGLLELVKAFCSDFKYYNYSDLDDFYEHNIKFYRKYLISAVEKLEIIEKIIAYREKQKHFLHPSCGSVFKNNYDIGDSIGKIVDDLGLKGVKKNQAMISPYHGNFIINLSNAKEKDVRYLISLISEEILKKYQFRPELEISLMD